MKTESAIAYSISIEGSDGAGKATQTEMLARRIEKQGFTVGRISFPRYNETCWGEILFERIKSPHAPDYDFAHANSKTASCIYAWDHLKSKGYIQKLLRENDYVIFDRYVESNLLHQGGKMRTREDILNFATWLYDFEYGVLELPRPDKIIYLDLPPEVSCARARSRAKSSGTTPDAVESDMEYVRTGAETGRLYAEHFGWSIVECVDAQNGYEKTPDEIHQEICSILFGT
jgi:dTMP kinase